MEELLGLWVKAETPIAIRLVFLALAGLVDGKPIRMTLWIGAKRPNLGGHWKYLGSVSDAIIPWSLPCFLIHLRAQKTQVSLRPCQPHPKVKVS